MKNILQGVFIISTILLNVKCTDEFSVREYPRIKTLPVTEMNSTGATFHADIIYRGDFEVVEYGFVWDDTRELKTFYRDKITFSDNIQNETFSSRASTTFQAGDRYYVKAFIRTGDYTVFGQAVEFENL